MKFTCQIINADSVKISKKYGTTSTSDGENARCRNIIKLIKLKMKLIVLLLVRRVIDIVWKYFAEVHH